MISKRERTVGGHAGLLLIFEGGGDGISMLISFFSFTLSGLFGFQMEQVAGHGPATLINTDWVGC